MLSDVEAARELPTEEFVTEEFATEEFATEEFSTVEFSDEPASAADEDAWHLTGRR